MSSLANSNSIAGKDPETVDSEDGMPVTGTDP
jgi:hypothetical protein